MTTFPNSPRLLKGGGRKDFAQTGWKGTERMDEWMAGGRGMLVKLMAGPPAIQTARPESARRFWCSRCATI